MEPFQRSNLKPIILNSIRFKQTFEKWDFNFNKIVILFIFFLKSPITLQVSLLHSYDI